jgi:hypothetical protein
VTVRWKPGPREDPAKVPYAVHYDPDCADDANSPAPICKNRGPHAVTDEPLKTTCLSCRKRMRDVLGIFTQSTNIYDSRYTLTKENLS